MTKTKKKYKVVIKGESCKGCDLCVEFCNKDVLKLSDSLNKLGYNYAESVNDDACVGCMICTDVCPEVIIEVYDE